MLGLVAACTVPGLAAAPTPSTAPSAAALWQQVQAEVGDARCSADAQCHSLAVGHKACGGPSAYLAWSSEVSREPVLTQRAEQYSQAQQAESARSGRLSTCSVLPDPGARCDALTSRCVLNSRTLPGAR
jgi:hypothetical protein